MAKALNLKDSGFGSPINLENGRGNNTGNRKPGDDKMHGMGAHAMISQFLNMKKNYFSKLGDMVGSDHHACRYFCTDDCAYIFSIDILQSLIDAIRDTISNKDHGATDGCVVLFQGLRKQEANGKTSDGGYSFGRPTLIATAYVQGSDNNLHYIKVPTKKSKTSEADDTPPIEAYEHPGDGTSGIAFISNNKIVTSDVTSAVVSQSENEYCDRDYRINTTITTDPETGKIGNWR